MSNIQTEIKKQQELFNRFGEISVTGWAKSPLIQYDRDDAKAFRFKIKERDSYFISNDEVGLNISVADFGIHATISATLVDFKEGKIHSKTMSKIILLNKISMPSSTEAGDVTYTDIRAGINFAKSARKRYIKCDFSNFFDGKNLYANIMLEQSIEDRMVTVIPFSENRSMFFYKQFLPQMRASGTIRCGGDEYYLNLQETTALLDWTRCSLPPKTCYHTMFAQGNIGGSPFAINLANNIGDTSNGTENCFFFHDHVHKLANIKITSQKGDITKPWRFTAGLSVLDITFMPMIKSGRLMTADTDKRTLVYGHISGSINQSGMSHIMIDAMPAFMEMAVL
ncbi:MAG: DUF2804 domain-containing protein [Bacillota bacterium]|nr:DUF2804 domain-containing protein [Bacillota bacterium]